MWRVDNLHQAKALAATQHCADHVSLATHGHGLFIWPGEAAIIDTGDGLAHLELAHGKLQNACWLRRMDV